MRAAGYVPRWLILPAALGLLFLLVPLTALIARVEWGTLISDVTSDAALSALGLSLSTGAAATEGSARILAAAGRAA